MSTLTRPPSPGWWTNRDNLVQHHYEAGARAASCGKSTTRKLYSWGDGYQCEKCIAVEKAEVHT